MPNRPSQRLNTLHLRFFSDHELRDKRAFPFSERGSDLFDGVDTLTVSKGQPRPGLRTARAHVAR